MDSWILNKVTCHDDYLIPKIDDSLATSRFFSSLYYTSGIGK